MALTYQAGAGVQTMPGVYTREIDLTQSVAASASTQSALAGVFAWGPVNSPRLVQNESELAATYGPPTNDNYETWFSGSNFLAYSSGLWVNRVVDNTAFSAVANTGNVTTLANHTVYNEDDFLVKSTSFEANVKFTARFPGDRGNSLRVAICGSADQYESTVNVASVGANTLFASANTKAVFTVGSNTAVITVANTAALTGNTPNTYINAVAATLTVGDTIIIGNTSIGEQSVKVVSVGTPLIANTAGTNTGYASVSVGLDQPVKLADDFSTVAIKRSWEFKNVISGAPRTSYSVSQSGNTAAVDEVHVVVVDEDGQLSGRANSILEVYAHASRATDGKDADGQATFYKKLINEKSAYLWAASDITGLPTTTGALIASATSTAPTSFSLTQGANGGTETSIALSALAVGYNTFANRDLYSLSSVIVGKTRGGTNGEQLFNYVIDNVAEVVQNIIVYGSVPRDAVVNNTDPLASIKAFRANLRRTSYAACDSGYKYMYDRYNDTYRFVPTCGDIAGISARTDVARDPWISPAGYNRGQIKNIVKLAYAPTESHQGELFSIDINPIVTTLQDGTFLLGDKTLLGQNSAFGSIGVRKLFNIIKTSIAKASKALLFEQNDEFSQSRFRSLTEPYLRDVKGRHGISDYRVVCDDSNNTDQVKANHQFVGDVYVLPTRSIRYINLNMVAVNSIADFSESA